MSAAHGITRELSVPLAPGPVSALLDVPADTAPWCACVLAHGAGAGMRHAFMEATARTLAARGIATLRFQFPYVEQGRRRVDPPEVAHAAVRAAVALAARVLPDVPLLAGGKSFGGRMTSQAQADRSLPGVRGLVFLGFPLHPPEKPGTERAAHLARVALPMLFLQGTRDEFARRDLLEPVVAGLGPRARLRLLEDGDHSFATRRRVSGRGPDEILAWLGDAIAEFARDLAGAAPDRGGFQDGSISV